MVSPYLFAGKRISNAIANPTTNLHITGCHAFTVIMFRVRPLSDHFVIILNVEKEKATSLCLDNLGVLVGRNSGVERRLLPPRSTYQKKKKRGKKKQKYKINVCNISSRSYNSNTPKKGDERYYFSKWISRSAALS